MKSVLISIQPKWVNKIASGEKTIEVRKTRPNIETPFKCYIYATKPKKYYKVSRFIATSDENLYLVNGKVKMDNGFAYWGDGVDYEYLNRKVIGEFVCDKIEMVNAKCSDYGIDLFYHDCMAQGCLTEREIEKYFNIPKDKDLRAMKGNGYAWHITDLKIYDKPKELSEFYIYDGEKRRPSIDCEHKKPGYSHDWCLQMDGRFCNQCLCDKKRLTRPPQSWCYVESGV